MKTLLALRVIEEMELHLETSKKIRIVETETFRDPTVFQEAARVKGHLMDVKGHLMDRRLKIDACTPGSSSRVIESTAKRPWMREGSVHEVCLGNP